MVDVEVEAQMGLLESKYRAAADPSRAAPMAAYMRNQFTFLGISATRRRGLDRDLRLRERGLSERELLIVVRACWALPEREFHYYACEALARRAEALTRRALPTVKRCIVTKSWWDTVDALAANVVGPLVRNRQLATTMDEWSASGNLWLIRTAVLHQLRARRATDTARLFGYCEAHATNREFFIRKAIGWALREHSKTDGEAVRRFVRQHPELSALSRREALKWLERSTARRR